MYIHPSSSLFQHQPPVKFVMYYELVMTSKSYMRQIMEIKPSWLLEGELPTSPVYDYKLIILFFLQLRLISSSPQTWSNLGQETKRCRRQLARLLQQHDSASLSVFYCLFAIFACNDLSARCYSKSHCSTPSRIALPSNKVGIKSKGEGIQLVIQ